MPLTGALAPAHGQALATVRRRHSCAQAPARARALVHAQAGARAPARTRASVHAHAHALAGARARESRRV